MKGEICKFFANTSMWKEKFSAFFLQTFSHAKLVALIYYPHFYKENFYTLFLYRFSFVTVGKIEIETEKQLSWVGNFLRDIWKISKFLKNWFVASNQPSISLFSLCNEFQKAIPTFKQQIRAIHSINFIPKTLLIITSHSKQNFSLLYYIN